MFHMMTGYAHKSIRIDIIVFTYVWFFSQMSFCVMRFKYAFETYADVFAITFFLQENCLAKQFSAFILKAVNPVEMWITLPLCHLCSLHVSRIFSSNQRQKPMPAVYDRII